MDDSSHDSICAVVVSYHPDAELPRRLRALREQVARIVVVDNGSGPDSEGLLRGAEQIDGLQLIRNETNLGIGAALNQGVGIARKDGFDWALTLDQDSEPAQDLVSALLHAYAQCGEPRQIRRGGGEEDGDARRRGG